MSIPGRSREFLRPQAGFVAESIFRCYVIDAAKIPIYSELSVNARNSSVLTS